MKTTFNLCERPGGCCPKLVADRTGEDLSFQIVDDYGGKVKLTDNHARLLALRILEELGKQ